MGKTNYQYVCSWECSFRLFWWCLSGTPVYCNANAITPEPPTTYIAESYKNAYETAFEAEGNASLNRYQQEITPSSLPTTFVNGTFGYFEDYGNIPYVSPLHENQNYYQGQPYLFISTGSGGGSGFMYLDWIITTFGVPYKVIVP